MKFERTTKILKHWRRILPDQLFGIVVGILATALVGLILWLFAYYGYTNFGLPGRFDFQRLNALVKDQLPAGYTYTTYTVNNFRGPDTQTVIAIGHNPHYYDLKRIGTDYADVMLLLDRTSKGYEVSYKFKPEVKPGSAVSDYGLRGGVISTSHINTQGKNDVLMGWFYVGADASPPYPLVFSDNQGKVVVNSIDKNQGVIPDFRGKEKVTISNFYDTTQKVDTIAVDGAAASKNSFAFIYITGFVCRACAEENTWQASTYTTYKFEPFYINVTAQYHGFTRLEQFLEANGYDVTPGGFPSNAF